MRNKISSARPARQSGVSLISVLVILAALGVATFLVARAFSGDSFSLTEISQKASVTEAMDQASGLKTRAGTLALDGVPTSSMLLGSGTSTTRLDYPTALPDLDPALFADGFSGTRKWSLGFHREAGTSKLAIFLYDLNEATCVAVAQKMGRSTTPENAGDTLASIMSNAPVAGTAPVVSSGNGCLKTSDTKYLYHFRIVS